MCTEDAKWLDRSHWGPHHMRSPQVAVPPLSKRLRIRLYTQPIAAANAPIIGSREYGRCVGQWCVGPCDVM